VYLENLNPKEQEQKDILNVVNRWRKMVKFTPLEFYFSRKYPDLPVHWMLGGSGCRGETSPVTARIQTPIT